MYKEKEVINAEIRTYTITTPCSRIQLPDHLSTLALKISTVKWLQFKHFSLLYVLFEACGAVFIMNSKIHLTKISWNEYLKVISHYVGVNSLVGLTADRCTELNWNHREPTQSVCVADCYYKEQSTANSNSFKIAQKTAFEVKGRLYTTGKVIQRLFIIDLYT